MATIALCRDYSIQELMSMLKDYMALRSKGLQGMATITLCRDYSMQELMSTKEDRILRYGTQKAEATTTSYSDC